MSGAVQMGEMRKDIWTGLGSGRFSLTNFETLEWTLPELHEVATLFSTYFS
jgi:hypothetical protein